MALLVALDALHAAALPLQLSFFTQQMQEAAAVLWYGLYNRTTVQPVPQHWYKFEPKAMTFQKRNIY